VEAIAVAGLLEQLAQDNPIPQKPPLDEVGVFF
jgi:hypothetical protein